VAAATVHTLEVIRCWATHFFLWDGIDPRSKALEYKCVLCGVKFRMGCSGAWKRIFVIWELELVKWGKDTLIQGDSGGKVKILGGDSVSHCAEKIRIAMFLIPNGYRDRAVPFYDFKTFVNDKKGEIAVGFIFILMFEAQTCTQKLQIVKVYNKRSKFPPSTSVHLAPRV
jgi:hypothetical protein